jgi:ankyrin repeat protein
MSGLLLILLCVAIGVYAFTRRRQTPTPSSSTLNGGRRLESPMGTRLSDPKQVALFTAAAAGDDQKLRVLLRDGVDPKFRNEEWVSPLGVAIVRDRAAVVRSLLDAGVDPNAPALQDEPALFVAVSYQRVSLIPDLVRAGSALDFADPDVGGTLAVASAKGDVAALEALFRAGAPVGLRSASGAAAIHIAATLGNMEVTKWLMDKGADIHCTNFQGGTPLRAAASTGKAEVVRLLLAAGADPAPVDAFERRPLDYAKQGGHAEVVKILRQAKPRPPSRRDSLRHNPLALTLPPRGDAMIVAIGRLREKGGTPTRVVGECLEAPSVIAAMRSAVGASFQVDFPVHDGTARGADPRLPSRPVETVLWTYEQDGKLTNEAMPAAPPPPDDILRLAAGVAEYPYVLSVWSKASAKVAESLREEDLRHVLAAMVHPPPGPKYLKPWDWHFRVQVAAALVASHLGGAERARSSSREALEAIADGPADWTNTAAVIALLDLARRDPTIRPLVVQAMVRTARRAVNPPAYQHAIKPAALALLEIPGVDTEVVNEMREVIDRG